MAIVILGGLPISTALNLLAVPTLSRYGGAAAADSAHGAALTRLGDHAARRFSLGLAAAIVCLLLFAGVTEDVLHHDPLTQADAAILDWFQSHHTAAGVRIFRAVSLAGSRAAMIAVGAAIAILLLVQRRGLAAAIWVAALWGAGGLNAALKQMIRRPRPAYASAILGPESGFSYPSGHAMESLVLYGMLAYLVVSLWTRRAAIRIAVICAAAALIGAIGLSRMYLGVHYFSDVAAGYAAALVWLSACLAGFEIVRRRVE